MYTFFLNLFLLEGVVLVIWFCLNFGPPVFCRDLDMDLL